MRGNKKGVAVDGAPTRRLGGHSQPNHGVQATPVSVRSAPAFGRA
jgi:hypothetical protein